MYKITSKWPHQDSIHVEWNLGKRCNLDCAYCPAEIHDNFSPHTNIKVLLDTVDALAELDKPIRVSFTGGEPCIHPDFEELIKHARQRLDWINVTTNGLRKAEWYAEAPVDHYVFSLHFDNEHWERAMDNIMLFAQHNENMDRIPFQVNVMAHHAHMDRVKLAVARFHGHNIPYVIRRIRWTQAENRDWFDDMRYAAKDLNWIIKNTATALPNCIVDDEQQIHANDVIKQHLNQFEGWTCSAGIESLMINWDGEVHRATCRVGGSLGNIYDGSFEAPEEWVTCTRKWCTCAADIPLTKFNPEA
jgi:MoaA/NifB/PqqE/SkfB family radical SAM enzyme